MGTILGKYTTMELRSKSIKAFLTCVIINNTVVSREMYDYRNSLGMLLMILFDQFLPIYFIRC